MSTSDRHLLNQTIDLKLKEHKKEPKYSHSSERQETFQNPFQAKNASSGTMSTGKRIMAIQVVYQIVIHGKVGNVVVIEIFVCPGDPLYFL